MERFTLALFMSLLAFLIYLFLLSFVWGWAIVLGLISGFALVYLGELVLDGPD